MTSLGDMETGVSRQHYPMNNRLMLYYLKTNAQRGVLLLEKTSMSCTDYKLVIISEVYTISNCTATNDTVCSRCEVGLVWSSDLSECVRCGPCCSNSVVYLGCSPDHGDPTMACIYDAACAGDKVPGLNSTGDVGWYQTVIGKDARLSHFGRLSQPRKGTHLNWGQIWKSESSLR